SLRARRAFIRARRLRWPAPEDSSDRSRLLARDSRGLDTGTSPNVVRDIDVSGRRSDIERRRGLRQHFLSRANVLHILRDPGLSGPRPEDYRGDLQMHSEWSDGEPTLGEINAACQARGYAYAAITDHSHG